MKGKYKAEYQLWWDRTSVDFEKDGYTSTDELKADTPAFVEERIKRLEIPDGEARLDLLIVSHFRGNETYVDHDSVRFTIKDGKMTDVRDN